MPKFIVERTVPGIADLPADKMKELANLVRGALKSMGGRMQWLESFVVQDKIFTIIVAPDEATVHEYSKLVNLPIDRIHTVKSVIDYTTGE
jgi:Protein of unknown function (DUF4242)